LKISLENKKQSQSRKKMSVKVKHLEARVNHLVAGNQEENSEAMKLRSAYERQKKKMADVKKYM
jgi:hypothetical protein